jgi:signal transduction histidine kinase
MDTYSSNTKSNTYSIEKSFFETICVILSIMMFYISIQSYLKLGVTALLLVDILLSIMFASFFYFSRYNGFFNEVKLPFILLVYAASIFFWVGLNGIYGSAPYALTIGSIISLLIVDKHHRVYIVGFSILLALTLVLVQTNTDLIKETGREVKLLSTNFFVIMTALLLIINYIKKKYDEERITVMSQYQELQEVNNALKTTLEEKNLVITQLKSTRDRLSESEKMASIGQLTARLAHELNNPLNYIGGVVTPLRKDLEDLFSLVDPSKKEEFENIAHEVEELLKTLSIGTKKASDVIKNLMNVTPETSTQKFEILNLHELIQRAHIFFTEHEGDILFEVNSEPNILVFGNGFELTRAFMQILQHCFRSVSSTEKARININVNTLDTSVQVIFSDNGRGIPEEELTKIFDPFFANSITGQEGELGLYLTHSIVKKHQGTIAIESSDKKGTVITITLPLAEDRPS